MTGTGATVWIVDDQPYEADFFAEATEKYGFETKVFAGPMEFALEIEDSRELRPDIRAIVMDSHFSGVASLGSIGRPDLRFIDGYRVGEALADQYLSQFPHLNDVPKVILTSFVENRATEPLKTAKQRLRYFSKSEPREFESFIRSLLVTPVLPDFALAAIVTPVGKDLDRTIIKLIQPVYDRLIKMLMADPRMMYEISPRRWEEIIDASYDEAGFDKVILTPGSGDFGRDVIAIKNGFGSVKFIEQVKAFKPDHLVTANDVRALVGVLAMESNASKAVFSTTSGFAPLLREDRLLKPLLPTRLELVDRSQLVERLSWRFQRGDRGIDLE